MSIYTGFPCPACEQLFQQGEDIVVCPDCGAPHHRGCYQQAGHCLLEGLHDTGEQWQPPVSEQSPPPSAPQERREDVSCPRCGAANSKEFLLCKACGWRLNASAPESPFGAFVGQGGQGGQQQQQQQRGFAGYTAFFHPGVDFAEEMLPGVTYKEVSDYVGPNSAHFLLKFRLMTRGAAITFNWPAFIFSGFYCFYRKMYKLGTVLTALLLIAFLPTLFFTGAYFIDVIAAYGVDTLMTLQIPKIEGQAYANYVLFNNIFTYTRLGVSVISGIYFNKAYMKEISKKILAVKNRGHYSTGSAEYSYALVRTGGTNVIPVVALVAGYFILNFLCVFFMMS